MLRVDPFFKQRLNTQTMSGIETRSVDLLAGNEVGSLSLSFFLCLFLTACLCWSLENICVFYLTVSLCRAKSVHSSLTHWFLDGSTVWIHSLIRGSMNEVMDGWIDSVVDGLVDGPVDSSWRYRRPRQMVKEAAQPSQQIPDGVYIWTVSSWPGLFTPP